MRKELVISSVARETRVAVVEDGELVELLIERARARGIAGNIYKGRVTKVLPGMQSAFVDIGLDRDAFLYVSDFLEDTDEYERLASTAEDEAFGSDEGTAGSGRRRSRGGRGRDRGRDRSREESKDSRTTVVEDDSSVRPEPGRTSSPEPQSREPASRDDGSVGGPAEETQESPKSFPDGIGAGAEADARRRRARGRTDRERAPAPGGASRGESRKPSGLQIIPGESLAKYRNVEAPDEPAAAEEVTRETFSEDDLSEDRSAEDKSAEVPASGNEGSESSAAEAESGEGRDATRGAVAGGESVSETAPESDAASSGSESDGDTPRPARIIDRGRSGELSRRAPSRRGRRRSPDKSEKPEQPSGKDGSAPRAPMISDLLKEGQEILVQVAKEPLGKKGARITSHIALPGRYLVYMPTVDHVGVSRKISSEDERARLKRIIAENRGDLPGGFIVRTAAEGRDEQEFVQDLRFLFDTWKEIREKNEKASAPAVIHADLGLVERVLRDQLTDEFKAIRLDNEVEYTKVLDFVSKFQPSLVNRVKLHLKDTPIFEEYGLQQEIDKALRSKVWLKSGGYIVVNQTEALVAIDVNTGKFVGKSNRLEDTIVRTNLDAVHEIVRQIRLRNLGGIIVVDFIDMEERKNRQSVMQALEEELEKDRSPSKILQFNDFGLVAITRKRTQASLERVLGTPCPRCSGSGYVKSVETVCYEIQQELRKMMGEVEGDELTVRVSPEVAKALKSAEFFELADLEEEARIDIRIQSDPLLAERFDIYE